MFRGILFINSRPARNTFPIKRMRAVWLLLIFLLTAFSVSSQTADITQGCVPLTVDFTAPTPSGPTHFWVFGDGATSTGENPQNTFVTPGTYNIDYSTSSGGPVLGTVTITVYEQLTPTFTTDPTEGCAPLLVNLENTTTIGAGINVTGVSWVFGDGSSTTGETPSQWFTQPGSFFVSLEIQTNLASCNATEVYNDAIVVTPGPNATFTTSPNPATACDPPLVVSFTNNSGSPNPITYDWDFGNGNTSTDEDPSPNENSENPNDHEMEDVDSIQFQLPDDESLSQSQSPRRTDDAQDTQTSHQESGPSSSNEETHQKRLSTDPTDPIISTSTIVCSHVLIYAR
ncbi:MAG: PKD domain-containing protein, partial [Flavobacteriales bacterium]